MDWDKKGCVDSMAIVLLIVVAIMAIVLTIIGTTAMVGYNNRRMAELGYEEAALPGSTYVLWQKAPAAHRRLTPPPAP